MVSFERSELDTNSLSLATARCISVILLHSSATATSMNTEKCVCLFYDLEFISLNFRVEIDLNDNFKSRRDCSRLKFYEIIKFTFRCRS